MSNMKQVNEHQMRISGKASLSGKLELSHDYKVFAEVSVISAKAKDRQDNTIDIEYSAKLITAEIIDDKGETIKTLDKRKMSQKLRFAINEVKDNDMDDEEYYEQVMQAVMFNLEEIVQKYV